MNRNHLPKPDNQAKAVEKENEKNYLQKRNLHFYILIKQ